MANPNKAEALLAGEDDKPVIFKTQPSYITDPGIRIVTTEVDASAGGTAQTTTIATVPAGSLLIGVSAKVTEVFDGDTTTTLEVGVSGNADAYIDTSDFDVTSATALSGSNAGTTNDVKTTQFLAAETAIIATWTNTASATTGKVQVSVAYLMLNAATTGTASMFDTLTTHGLIADS